MSHTSVPPCITVADTTEHQHTGHLNRDTTPNNFSQWLCNCNFIFSLICVYLRRRVVTLLTPNSGMKATCYILEYLSDHPDTLVGIKVDHCDEIL